ncbi:MAG: hypothetical protein HZB73_05350 [Nitrosarchaeum sp.]|nr:hypothetical protein [Nitrosarchaeum sp.]
MNKIIAVLLIGILLTISLVAVNSAYASSWDNNPHENLSKDKQVNQSHGTDYIKHKVVRQHAYGYSHSKVCGLELCPNAKNDTPSYSFLKGHGTSAGMPSQKYTSDGKVHLKGHNKP